MRRLLLALLPAALAFASASPEKILEAINARPGDTVCEIGAGDGSASIAAARVVGPTGRVYTSELGESRVKKLRASIASSNLPQITVVEGESTSTNFPATCDAIWMRDVYHHFTDPAAMNASIAASLKPGGRVAVVDFTPPDKEAADPAARAKDGQHGVTPETVTREMKDAGLYAVSTEKPGQRWFIVVLAKPAS
ncbi:MAG: methyltransferase domain-containing protein [Bryobacteraceae bacterium]|nr:methyltransferase domain-containing protein [Bryobacteraceae bacterium]